MPLVEFIGPTGERIERLTHHSTQSLREDGQTYTRAPVSRFAFTGRQRSSDQRAEVLRGYYRKELQEGARFRSRFSKAKIKAVWDRPQED